MKFFTLEELRCRDGTPVPEDLRANAETLIDDVLDPIREAWKGPLHVRSGYRTPAWNEQVGGEDKSWHMKAKAADIEPEDVADVPKLHALILALYRAGQLPKLGGLGRYGSFCHVDSAKAADGHLRRWNG